VIALSSMEKVEKILRLALCPSAPQGEWESAALALIRTLRSSGARAEDVLSTAASATAPTAVNSPIMPFGRHRDRTRALDSRERSFIFRVGLAQGSQPESLSAT
jgi:hypothetical protein